MNFLNWLLSPIRKWRERREFKRRLEDLRKRDPFIYK
jgi:hypothetical protein